MRMSGATTRGKYKKQKHGDVGDISSDILRKIHSTGEVTQGDIHQLYMIWKPVCQGCRVNSKDSPNCFCGLVPPINAYRKYGLWQKTSETLASLGPDPTCEFRCPSERPAGLTNLGATCYANSILQCLYMNTSVRNGIFSLELDVLKKHPVLDNLSRLFAQLRFSNKAFVDSAPIIKTLELDNGVQQDSDEFLTLLLSLLEKCLRSSSNPKARTLIPDLFRGSLSHVTRCSTCGKYSATSSKMEDFYELELNIKGFNNLDESLDDYLSVEELSGENQYLCEFCGHRVDAARCIKLETLPTVLHFQLKRYVFLPKTTKRKKVVSKFSFPKQLEMASRVCGTLSDTLTYDLSAILIHKGAAVNSGHYVVHIRDKFSGNWWKFDDEEVSELGMHPFGEKSSSSCATIYTKNSNSVMDVAQPPSLHNYGIDSQEAYSSEDAYMLMYTQSCHLNNFESDTVGNLVNEVNDEILPLHLCGEIEEHNKLHDIACKDYQLKKDTQLMEVKERQKEVRTVLSLASVESVNDPYFWISTVWLRQWAENLKPIQIQNSEIMCTHGRVPFSKIGAIKRISDCAWKKLSSRYGGGPALTEKDCCIACLKEAAKTTVLADGYRDRRAVMKLLAEEALTGQSCERNKYIVSRNWLIQWLRRRNADMPSDGDADPTTLLACPHGKLLPEQAPGAKRVLVPEILWLFFLENAQKVKGTDWSGHLTFPLDSETCAICSIKQDEEAFMENQLRETKMQHRENHKQLYLGKGVTLVPGCKYYLLPSSWLSRWRSYLRATGRNVSACEGPGNLEIIINSLKCDKHSQLLMRPYDLIYRRGEIIQKASNVDGLVLITESDWNLLCEEWIVSETKGITAVIEMFPNCGEVNPSAVQNASNDAMDSELDLLKPVIRTSPLICDSCIVERENHELLQKLNYYDEEIHVHLVKGKEPPRAVLAASAAISGRERHTSKHSRRASSGESVNLSVSGFTSLYQLKMMIWESFGIVKENQKLHKGSMEIENDSATLADLNILPGDVLWVIDTEIHENRDIADELLEQKVEFQQAEGGFKGTLLASNALTKLTDKESEDKNEGLAAVGLN